MSKVYVDNAKNRKLGRVGKPLGSMPESKKIPGGDHSGPSVPNDQKVGAASGRGQATGSFSGHTDGAREKVAQKAPSPGTYADNYTNRQLNRVGLPKGSAVVSKSGGRNKVENSESVFEESNNDVDARRPLHNECARPKVYVDNAQNRKLGRVGMQHGEAVVYKNDHTSPTPATQTKVYMDTPQNRRLGRVGLPVGTKVFSSKTKSIIQENYDDTSINRKLGRVGKPRGCLPVQHKSKTTKKIPELLQKIEAGDEFKDYEFEDRGTDSGDLEYGLLDSQGARMPAFDQAMYRHNRNLEELSWKQYASTKCPPKTEAGILKDYKGKKIPFTELKLRKIIGRGGFGQVYFAKWNETVVAVKKLQREKISGARIRDFSEEVMKFCTLDHPNVVKFIGDVSSNQIFASLWSICR